MRSLAIYLGLSLCLAVSACLRPYEYDTSRAPQEIVIFGEFTSQDTFHYVEIRRLSGYGEGPGEPIPFAIVRLNDDTGEFAFYEALGDGRYRLNPLDMRGEPGRTYELQVEFSNGKSFRSVPQRMLPRIEADSAYFEIRNDHLSVYLDTPVPTDEDVFYRWSHDEVYSFVTLPCNPFNNTTTCYFQADIGNPRFFTGTNRGLAIDQLNLQRVVYDPGILGKTEQFRNRHFYNIYQRRIDEAAYEYWQQLDQVVNQQGTIFDPIPAPVRGNISNIDDPAENVWGYFEVATVDTVRTVVRQSDLQMSITRFVPYCPNLGSYSDYINYLQSNQIPPQACCNCGVLEDPLPYVPDYF